MIHLYRLSLALLSILLLNRCDTVSGNKNDITGLWNFSGSGGKSNDTEEEAYLDLRPDKTYTFYQPHYFDYGHWTYTDKKIRLVSDRKKVLYLKEWEFEVVDREKEILKVTFTSADKLHALPVPADEKEKIAYTIRKNIFLEHNNVQFDPDKDPFSLEHSRWRIRPDHKETCEEIKQRVIGNLQHLSLLFSAYAKADVKDVSWMHSPHPYFLASNGISLEENSNLPDDWINTFFDAENETDAYLMISMLMDEDLDIPLHYTKYSELWYSLLNQMYNIAKQKDLCKTVESKQHAGTR